MEDNPVVNFFKAVLIYFATLFILTWLAEKFFCDFAYIKIFFMDGKFLKAILLAALAYGVYFLSASVVASEVEGGKEALFAIIAFSVYGIYDDVSSVVDTKKTSDFIGMTIIYLLYTLEDTLRIIAAIHAFKDEL